MATVYRAHHVALKPQTDVYALGWLACQLATGGPARSDLPGPHETVASIRTVQAGGSAPGASRTVRS